MKPPAPYAPTLAFLRSCRKRGINLASLRCDGCGQLTMLLGANDETAPNRKYCERCYAKGTNSKELPE